MGWFALKLTASSALARSLGPEASVANVEVKTRSGSSICFLLDAVNLNGKLEL